MDEMPKRIGFTLECSCGEKTEGAFFEDDYSETLHCRCGKVWVISRPYEHPNLLSKDTGGATDA